MTLLMSSDSLGGGPTFWHPHGTAAPLMMTRLHGSQHKEPTASNSVKLMTLGNVEAAARVAPLWVAVLSFDCRLKQGVPAQSTSTSAQLVELFSESQPPPQCCPRSTCVQPQPLAQCALRTVGVCELTVLWCGRGVTV